MADKVLIVDDDISICKLLEKVMHSNELDTEVAGSGKEALELLKHHTYDVILMDIMLGDMEGFDVIKELRASGIQTPVMIVSGRNEDYDSLYGLSIGADDYITKPFSFIELAGRIRAILRRCKGNINKTENNLTIKNLKLDLLTREAKRGDREIELTYREFALLEYLIRNKNLVLSRTMIREKIWNMNYTANTNIVDVYMTHLRNKIDKGEEEKIIYTVRGVGYILKG